MTAHPEGFGSRALLLRLSKLPRPATRYWVAFSGGVDSTALLHALVQCRDALQAPIHVLHVNHGLDARADEWQSHCESVCRAVDLPYVARRVEWPSPPRANIEARARKARYGIAAGLLAPGDVLLTAHHRDDQAETLLLALMRGSGVDGLGAMPPVRPLHPGWLARPLLDFGRAELLAWLDERGLKWLDDPANDITRHDRNHLRHVVLPALTERWPDAAARVARSAGLCRDASQTMASWGRRRLDARLGWPVLHMAILDGRDDAESRVLLRTWLRDCGADGLPRNRLRAFLDQAGGARRDARTECRWNGWRLHAWHQRLWLSRTETWREYAPRSWRTDGVLHLPGAGGTLALDSGPESMPASLVVRPRRPGDRIRPAGARHHRRVKDLLREWRIPPWMRGAVPIVEHAGTPVAVADRVIGHDLAGDDRAGAIRLRWTPADPVLEHEWRPPKRMSVDPPTPLR